jgi:lipopolysaccharide export system ATP-binding protein
MRFEAKGLEKSYRRRKVVDQVSLAMCLGEVVGLLGPNGAGKTTIFSMMIGLVRPDGGEIYLDEEAITHFPMHLKARRGISYLPQEPSIFRKLTVRENLLLILETLKISRSEQNERLGDLLKELSIAHLEFQKAYTLSGGERRRVEIARVLVTQPRFILLDEPFAGIDPIAVAEIQQIVTQLKKKDIGILITDHNVQETLAITDRAYIINEGKILESGSPREIAESPRARALYLGERFRLKDEPVHTVIP